MSDLHTQQEKGVMEQRKEYLFGKKDDDDSGDDKAASDQNVPVVEDDPALLMRAEYRPGKFSTQQRLRIIRPSRSALERVGQNVLKATEDALRPESGTERFLYAIRRVLIGRPLANEQAVHERLSKVKALAVLSSDAISSVAYGTEEILGVLILAGAGALGLALPIAIAIAILLAIVALSYRQTIPAYPNGGGSYIVAKDNLGTLAGLIAAASLLIDYVLTVAVSVASGVQNLASLFPALTPYIVTIDVGLVIFITVVNLRGVRESGSVFAVPTYLFIGSALLLIVVGLFKLFILHIPPRHVGFVPVAATEPLTLFLILKAFASGCSAMTGTEAISNGIPVFKKPEPHNAAITLTWMATILGTLFLGITVLALSYHIEPYAVGYPTVIAQIAQQAFTGPLYFMFPVFQISTLLILTLAANTSYADFPRLASLLARDNFMPHQFAFRGDRLAFSTGITFLAGLSILLLVVFKGDTSHLIDLYAVGVFMSFTLSQGGMVRHWWKLKNEHRGWQRSMVINGLGAFTTLVVAVVIATTKFLSGAWIVVILIPLLVLIFLGIHKHYMRVERERTTGVPNVPTAIKHLFVVPIATLDAVSIQSLAYARSLSPNVIAVHVAVDEGDAERVREEWNKWKPNIALDEKTELVIIDSPYRSLTRPLLYYIDTLHELYPEYTITVLLPEFVVSRWWEYLLHNQTALRLKAALLFRPGIVVTDVPQHLYRGRRA
jgi:amino acid transporter